MYCRMMVQGRGVVAVRDSEFGVIMNCTKTCPKHLNPGAAIGELKKLMMGSKSDGIPYQNWSSVAFLIRQHPY